MKVNGNQLKLVACIAMLTDHIGYLLFPQVLWLRCVGRMALPIFAFLLAEGCRYTHDRRRYFGRMLGLGCLCQTVYIAELLLGGGTRYMLLNILLTLSVSQLLCFAWLDLTAAQEAGGTGAVGRAAVRFWLLVAAAVVLNYVGRAFRPLCGVLVEFDYGLAGMLLPLAALLGKTPVSRLVFFGVGLGVFCLFLCGEMPYTWFALLTLPLLALYSGQRGSHRWQPIFYAFYPVHLAVLYGLSFLL